MSVRHFLDITVSVPLESIINLRNFEFLSYQSFVEVIAPEASVSFTYQHGDMSCSCSVSFLFLVFNQHVLIVFFFPTLFFFFGVTFGLFLSTPVFTILLLI